MNMSTDDALQYIAEHQSNTSENEEVKQPVEVETKEEQSSAQPSDETKTDAVPTSDTADDKKEKKEDRPDIKAPTGSDEPAEVKDEKADDKAKKDRSHKEERDYAFIREKNKRKAQRERYEAEIKSLKDELEKYKGLKLEDFKGDQQQYIDYRIDQQNQRCGLRFQ